jgi:hypothetical protein
VRTLEIAQGGIPLLSGPGLVSGFGSGPCRGHDGDWRDEKNGSKNPEKINAKGSGRTGGHGELSREENFSINSM